MNHDAGLLQTGSSMKTTVRKGIPMVMGALLLYLLVLSPSLAYADDQPKKNPLVIYLNDDKTRFIKFGFWAQFWGRSTDLNPGSQFEKDGPVHGSSTDFTIRRLRASMNAQLTERAMGFFQIGFNNWNSRYHDDVSIDVLDAFVQYDFADSFAIGGGKSIWRGLSRYAAPAANQFLTLDLTFAALPTLNITDDTLRTTGIWVKGQISRLDYRIIVFEPEKVGDRKPGEDKAVISDDGNGSDRSISTYVKWQFFDKESNHMPASPGTYLGKKKVLNLGVGYEFRNNGTEHLEQGDSVFNDLKLWTIDIFADIPLGKDKRTAFTAYAAFFNYKAGPNALRNLGPNNSARFVDPSQASFNGAGNAYPIVGTGNSFYIQAGYLFPPMGGGKFGRLQPFFDFQTSDFDRLSDQMNAWNVGVHWLIRGMKSRLSFAFQSRPVFYADGDRVEVGEHKGMSILQYQFMFN